MEKNWENKIRNEILFPMYLKKNTRREIKQYFYGKRVFLKNIFFYNFCFF
jgi:hypothetical protein